MQFPLASVQKLIMYLSNQGNFSYYELFQAVMEIASWAGTVLFTSGQFNQLDFKHDKTEGDLASYLRDLEVQHTSSSIQAFSVPPWVIPILLDLIKQFLTRP
jgi:hypothetical protein